MGDHWAGSDIILGRLLDGLETHVQLGLASTDD